VNKHGRSKETGSRPALTNALVSFGRITTKPLKCHSALLGGFIRKWPERLLGNCLISFYAESCPPDLALLNGCQPISLPPICLVLRIQSSIV